MRTLVAMVALALAASPALAQTQRKDCGELKSEIDTKIRNNGVKVFTLTVVAKDAAEDGKVVGTCDGGTNKIVYKRGATEAPAPAAVEAKPQSK
jgi:hypothetical protein